MSCSFANSGSSSASGMRVKGEIPGGVPRVFPLVRHRDDVGVVEMRPFAIATGLTAGGRRRVVRIAVQPFGNVVVEVLLAPDHSGERLPLDGACISAGHSRAGCRRRTHRRREMRAAKDLVEVAERMDERFLREAQADFGLAVCRHHALVPDRRLRAVLLRVDRVLGAIDHAFIDAVLPESLARVIVPELLRVRLVVAEQCSAATRVELLVVAYRNIRPSVG